MQSPRETAVVPTDIGVRLIVVVVQRERQSSLLASVCAAPLCVRKQLLLVELRDVNKGRRGCRGGSLLSCCQAEVKLDKTIHWEE